MALPKKGSRLITVLDHRYRWIVTGNDDVIDLVIQRADCPEGRLLRASFSYLPVYRPSSDKPGAAPLRGQGQRITPAAVRKVIVWALSNSWDPSETGRSPFGGYPG